MLVCVALGLASGCGKGPEPAKPAISNKAPADPPATSEYQQGLAALLRFRDQFCACTDANCATRVSDDMTKWSQEATKQWGEDQNHAKFTEEQTKEMSRVAQQMAECMSKAMTAKSP